MIRSMNSIPSGMLWIAQSGAQWREIARGLCPGNLRTPILPNGGMLDASVLDFVRLAAAAIL